MIANAIVSNVTITINGEIIAIFPAVVRLSVLSVLLRLNAALAVLAPQALAVPRVLRE